MATGCVISRCGGEATRLCQRCGAFACDRHAMLATLEADRSGQRRLLVCEPCLAYVGAPDGQSGERLVLWTRLG